MESMTCPRLQCLSTGATALEVFHLLYADNLDTMGAVYWHTFKHTALTFSPVGD